MKKFKKDIDSAKKCPLDKNDIVHNKPPSKPIVETWNKKRKNSCKKNKTSSTYQKPPPNDLHFSATESTKQSRKQGKVSKPDSCINTSVDNQPIDLTHEIETKSPQKTPCFYIDSNDDLLHIERDGIDDSLLDTSMGYSLYKRVVYDEVKRKHASVSDARKTIRRSLDKLNDTEKSVYTEQASNEVCSSCGKEDGERGNGDTNYWILCSFCSSWYHISCLMLDNAYSCAALTSLPWMVYRISSITTAITQWRR